MSSVADILKQQKQLAKRLRNHQFGDIKLPNSFSSDDEIDPHQSESQYEPQSQSQSQPQHKAHPINTEIYTDKWTDRFYGKITATHTNTSPLRYTVCWDAKLALGPDPSTYSDANTGTTQLYHSEIQRITKRMRPVSPPLSIVAPTINKRQKTSSAASSSYSIPPPLTPDTPQSRKTAPAQAPAPARTIKLTNDFLLSMLLQWKITESLNPFRTMPKNPLSSPNSSNTNEEPAVAVVPVPTHFTSVQHYLQVWAPLCLRELKAEVAQYFPNGGSGSNSPNDGE